MKAVLAIGLILRTLDAAAGPCDREKTTLTDDRKAILAAVVDSQLHVSKAKIVGSFRRSGWYVIHAETPESDPPFLFFHGDPTNHRYVALWSGAGMVGEKSQIVQWVVQHAPGIPKKLVSCFASLVTPQ
jgi:hypothetical protein